MESSKPWLFLPMVIVLAIQRFIISVGAYFHPRNSRVSIFEKLSCKSPLQRPFYLFIFIWGGGEGRMYMFICVAILST